MSAAFPSELEQLRRHKMRLEEDVARLITIDQLTGFLNRNAFMHRVDAQFKASDETPPLAAMIEFGLRGLPRIAGSLGRHVGDYVVSALSARLHAMAESSSLVCRLDHHSFALFVPRITDALEAMSLAKTCITRLSQPIDWVDRKLTIEMGAGVALRTSNDQDAATLLHNAGLAYKSATDRGGPGYAFFNPALASASRRRNDIQIALHDALEHQHFKLVYQPCFNSMTGELASFEALLRLEHPQYGNIPPAEFIPVAEENGLISKIGAWALAEACRTAVHWPQHLTVAVNVSPEQFLDGTLMTDIHHALELSSFPAYRLELEITESTMMSDTEVVMSQLESLKDMGCSIVLDDFGTGYSSLSYLWKFAFSKIKIDRSFVHALETTPRVRGMLSAIMNLSRNLGLKVTAEGIETPVQASLCQDMGCEYIQGYLTGRPMSAEDIPAMVMKRFAKELKARVSAQELPLAPTLKLGGGFG
jgi:diguanylate cyclase (GGDEF)-like protein